jgi:putative ABC transport system substrate-binding protein
MELVKSRTAALGLSVAPVSVAAPAELEAAFSEIARARPGALLVLTDNSLLALADVIAARSLSERIPAFGAFNLDFVRAGALLSYGRELREAYQSVARFLKQILSGAKPADLPVEQPTKFTLFINLRTAKTLGLKVPESLLLRADEVVE